MTPPSGAAGGTGTPGAARRRDAGAAALTVLLVVVTAVAALGGAGLLGWTAWQRFGASTGAAAEQRRAAVEAERRWAAPPSSATPARPAARVPVAEEPRATEATIATVRVPRFGRGWVRLVRQGIEEQVLDSFDSGVGHYPGTAMPGGVGNLAVAAHDTGWGDAFRRLKLLRAGDRIVVTDRLGTYTYAFRDLVWVQPSAVDVLLPVPERTAAAPSSRLITLTTCDPPYHAAERLVAYGELVAFAPAGGEERTVGTTPAADPASVAALRQALAELRAPSRASVARAVRAAGLTGRLSVSADRTSIGSAVPSLQVGLRQGRACLIGQVGVQSRYALVTTARPVSGECLIGDPARLRAP